ncbi:sigma-54 interaction domain-containing protein [Viridibacillus arvi]|uniref:sigma-54 interaction domain-containing protein n=1 Tax=Viridibacillus arvi TaxID=263475 RepID=UPI0006A9E054|nr:sigma 54-interacting transcriptional regulator [Viridibacillus arvi]
MIEELKRLVDNLCTNVIVMNEQFEILWWKTHPNLSLQLRKNISICEVLQVNKNELQNNTIIPINGYHYKIKLESYLFEDNLIFLTIEDIGDLSNNQTNRIICLEEVLEKLNEGVIVSDRDGSIIYYNKAQEEMEQMKKNEVLNNKLWDVYKYNRRQSEHAHIFKTGKPIYAKYKAHSKTDNGPQYVGYSSFPIQKDGQTIAVFSISHTETSLKNKLLETIELKRSLVTKDLQVIGNTNGTLYTFENIKGDSHVLKKAIEEAQNISLYDTDALIVGETGTGKELFAQSMHNFSPRANNPFVAVNCAAIPENLLESTLFGSVKGAFTGAIDQEGLFEYAKDGTLFLDEINSLPITLQPKLMRVLQERAVRRVGSNKLIPITCSVISASNEDPELLASEGRMRLDLFYRIAHASIYIPPLRERAEDILFFINHFLSTYQKKYLKQNIILSPTLYKTLLSYDWPGNTRELQHLIENLVIQAKSNETVFESFLPYYLRKKLSITDRVEEMARPLKSILESNQANYIENILVRNKWNITVAAKQLNISRQSLQYHIKKLGLVKSEEVF